MFKKPATLKPASPLRSSARRAFIAHLQALYPALAGAPPEVIQVIVPVGLKQGGATTSAGLRAVIYTDEAGKPFWFEVGHDAGAALQQSQEKKKADGASATSQGKSRAKGGGGGALTKSVEPKLAEVLPTVYALWVMPNLLPRLPTWTQIVDPVLLSGSALMVPGLIPPPHTYPDEFQRYVKLVAEAPSLEYQHEPDRTDASAQAENEASSVPSSSSKPAYHAKPIKSSLVAITPYPSPIPLVLARLEADMDEIVQKRAAGEKGKAATTLHALGDHLWELGGKMATPRPEDVLSFGVLDDKVMPQADTGPAGALDGLENETAAASLESPTAGRGSNGNNHDTDVPDAHQSRKKMASDKFAISEVDAVLYLSLLTSLLDISKQPATTLPLPVSALYSTHVLPNRPAHWPPRDPKGKRVARLPQHLVSSDDEERQVDAEGTDVRHSTAKKLAKWLKVAEKNELLKTKDVKGKDTVVTSINTRHPDIKALVPYLTLARIQQDVNNAAGPESSTVAQGTASSSAGQEVKTIVVIERFWRPAAAAVQLFQEMGWRASELLSRPVIKAYLLDYIAHKELVDPRNQALVRVQDPLLTHALYPKMPLNQIPAALRREEMLERLLSTSCQEFHRTSRLLPERAARVLQVNTKGSLAPESGGGTKAAADDVVEADAAAGEQVGPMSKGAAQAVKIEVRTRQGRKVITLITSLEVYGIDAEAFAGELMRIVGAAASSSKLPSSSAKYPKYEIFVQGDQRKTILELLEAQHGLNERFVQVHDMTKK